MKRRIARFGSLIAVIAAASLVVATQAGAETSGNTPVIGCTGSAPAQTTRALSGAQQAGVHYVAGYSKGERMRGSLKGTWKWTGPNGGFDAFLGTMKYNQATGVMRFKVPEVFTGSLAGVGKGTLTVDGAFVQVAKPGTPLYDFTTYPSPQPGTTGDPKQWLGGWCVHKITGGTGAFEGASGVIQFRDIRFLTDANYWGIIRLENAA
jgi:hypothetical protein